MPLTPVFQRCDLVLIVPFQDVAAFGPRIIEAYLRSKGCGVALIFFKGRSQVDAEPTERELSLLVELVKDLNPNRVGISVMSPSLDVARKITAEIRKTICAPIVWGGIHPTICPEECIDEADICCRGEGQGWEDLFIVEMACTFRCGNSVLCGCALCSGDHIVSCGGVRWIVVATNEMASSRRELMCMRAVELMNAA